MDKDEYEKAWKEDDAKGPITDAVQAAAKKKASEDEGEFLRAFIEDDEKDGKK